MDSDALKKSLTLLFYQIFILQPAKYTAIMWSHVRSSENMWYVYWGLPDDVAKAVWTGS